MNTRIRFWVSFILLGVMVSLALLEAFAPEGYAWLMLCWTRIVFDYIVSNVKYAFGLAFGSYLEVVIPGITNWTILIFICAAILLGIRKLWDIKP